MQTPPPPRLDPGGVGVVLIGDAALRIDGSREEILTSLFAVTARALEDAGIDHHTADELAQRILVRVEDRWQAIGLVVRNVDGADT